VFKNLGVKAKKHDCNIVAATIITYDYFIRVTFMLLKDIHVK